MKVVTRTSIDAYPLLSRGKVRDIYEIDERTLLIVTTDRMSAFDVIMSEPVPYKGVVLNLLTLFWMNRFEYIIPNHVLESDVERFPAKLAPWREELEGRAIIARKAQPLPVECIVRGYLSGSGWKSYLKSGEICGIKLPEGLEQAAKLNPPIFTPSTKAAAGHHDENIGMAQAAALLGDEAAEKVSLASLALYEKGAAHAASRGILVADTKFEFGYINGTLHLIDEVLTPDSSRFWPADSWQPGHEQPSYDKQYLRDWLNSRHWNHEPPPPALPKEVVDETAAKYRKAYEILTGKDIAAS